MKKTTLYAVALVVVLALLAGVFVWQKGQKQTNIQNQTAQQSSEGQPESNPQNEGESEGVFSPQHIVAIPGSQQVWYEVPEMGIKLLLSKEAAEELVYRYAPKRDVDIFVEMQGLESQLIKVKDVESVVFFWKKVVDFRKKCDQSNTDCRTSEETIDLEFYINKIPDVYHGEGFAFSSGFLKQFPNFYLIGANRRESYGMSEEEFVVFETTVLPYLPGIPSLKNIRIELLDSK